MSLKVIHMTQWNNKNKITKKVLFNKTKLTKRLINGTFVSYIESPNEGTNVEDTGHKILEPVQYIVFGLVVQNNRHGSLDGDYSDGSVLRVGQTTTEHLFNDVHVLRLLSSEHSGENAKRLINIYIYIYIYICI